jgi:hypothetical protein
MKYLLTFTLLASFTQLSYSQEPHWTPQLLETTDGKKVSRWEEPASFNLPWVSVVKIKKKEGLFTVTIGEDVNTEGNDSTYVAYVNNPIKAKYDQIATFKSISEEDSEKVDALQGQHVEVAEVRIKKEVGIIVRYGDDYELSYLDSKHLFQLVDWKKNSGIHVPVMIDDKWGIYDWYQQCFLFECEYTSVDDLPKTTISNGFNAYSAEIFKAFNKLKKWEEIDVIDLDNGNGDGIFLAQSKATDKFGMYQYIDKDNIIEAVPMKYDSLYYFSWNGNFTAVFNEGKVGIYLSYWTYEKEAKESVPCIYEDYKNFNREEDNTKLLAVKKNGKWGWIDWLTGEEKSDFKYETTKDLPYPYYEQKYWLEE